MQLDPKGLQSAARAWLDTEGTSDDALERAITAYLSTVTPAEAGGLVERLNIKAGVMEMGERIAWGSDTAIMREAATALAAKDAELARRDMQLEASAKVALDLSAQLAEANKALDELREELACEIEERLHQHGDDMGDTGAARLAELRRAREQGGGRMVDRLKIAQAEERHQLRKEVATLKAENERLAKALATLSKDYSAMQVRAVKAERAGGVRFVGNIPGSSSASGFAPLTTEPAAQEGRQPVAWLYDWTDDDGETQTDASTSEVHSVNFKPVRNVRPLYTRPAEQAVTEARKFSLGDRVTKIKGSSWTGRVVGFYSTTLTPIGYAIESETETGSVQIYPETALKAAMEAGR